MQHVRMAAIDAGRRAGGVEQDRVDGRRRLLPSEWFDEGGCDGFYIARFVRNS